MLFHSLLKTLDLLLRTFNLYNRYSQLTTVHNSSHCHKIGMYYVLFQVQLIKNYSCGHFMILTQILLEGVSVLYFWSAGKIEDSCECSHRSKIWERTPGTNLHEVLVIQRAKDPALGSEVLDVFYLNVSIFLFF